MDKIALQCGLSEMENDPLNRRIQQHADRRLRFDPGTKRKDILLGFREFLRLETEMLRRYHRKGDSGTRVAFAYTLMMDAVVTRLFQMALSEVEGGDQADVCLVALGGYGRSELSPFSDVDIMFLFPSGGQSNADNLKKALTDTLLYMLWDLNLKVGHSTRTVKETLTEAKSDVQTFNALLENRFITGSRKVYGDFERAFRSHTRRLNDRAYIEERLTSQKERRQKHGDNVFVQEPEIKNGVGGLRDYQNILWMTRARLKGENLAALVENGLLEQDEINGLEEAYDFLIRTRNELHFESERHTDVLTLDKQPRIAWELGYRIEDIFRRVERFMRDYYTRAHLIYQVSLDVEQQLFLSAKRHVSFREVIASHSFLRRHEVDGFMCLGDSLEATSSKVFQEDPERLVRVFRHSQQLRLSLGAQLRRLIRQNLPLITGKVITSPEANRSFRSILQTVGEVYPTLAQMHELGVLGRFLPEFGRLYCLVQHEFYHRYTADVHTLHTIRELDRVFAAEEPETQPYFRELQRTSTPGLLYLVLLLHDIGKAFGIKGHAERGAHLAEQCMERLGVAQEQRAQVLFIIRMHLEMARFSQKYDLDDPRTAEAFAREVETTDRLRYLYVHTYCDARGTAANLWNSFKNMLHNALFANTLSVLEGGTVDPHQSQQRRREMIPPEAILDACPSVGAEEVEAHYNLLPERYFLHASKDDVVLHIEMVHELLAKISGADSLGSLMPVVEWRNDVNLSMTVVNIVTWDRPGLFYKLAGAFAVAGINILSSRAISRADHILIDTFYVSEPGGGIVQNEVAREQFVENLHRALVENEDLLPRIQENERKRAKPAYLRRTERLSAPLPPSVDVYHELSLRRTIIEVQASDQIGLLYKLARAIYERGFDITFARISTERAVAMDTFYIEPVDKAREAGTANLLALREALNEIITPPNLSSAVGE